MSRQLDERYQEMTVEEFRSRYNFVLSDPQRENLKRAEGLGLKIGVLIGEAPWGRYLLELEAIEE
jgi:hypothetical protein